MNLGLLVGCSGSGTVLDGRETGGTDGSGGSSSGGKSNSGSGASGGISKGGSGAAGSGGDQGGAGGDGAGGFVGPGAAPGYGGAGGIGAGGLVGPGAAPGYGGAGGIGAGAAPGYGGAGAAPGSVAPDPADCQMLLAPSVELPEAEDTSRCFGFTLSADPAKQISAIFPEFVDPRWVHHMVLYRAPSGALPSGECPADDAKGTLIYAFAPGALGLELPPDVGLGIGTGRFTVEVHYGYSAQQGVAPPAGFCAVLTDARPHEAVITRLGRKPITVAPGGGTSTSICAPPITDGARILYTTLDLGSLGTQGRAIFERRAGGFENFVDLPVNDALGATLYTPANLDSGDSIYTACVHANSSSRTVDSYANARCNFWMLTYPLGQFGEDCGN